MMGGEIGLEMDAGAAVDDAAAGEGSSSAYLLADWSPSDAAPTTRADIHRPARSSSASALYLICLTIGVGGLQVVWTAIMSQGSPFLSALGLPNYIISLIWLSGPLSGAIVQPFIGALSDRSTSKWGRRRPFIAVGTVVTIISMMMLPWTHELVELFVRSPQSDPPQGPAFIAKGMLAALLILVLNVALQPVQAGLRSLIVECCPPSQQVRANSYASSIVGIGSIFGYCSGFISLPEMFPFLGDTNFKGLCAIASVALGSTVCLTCAVVDEPRPLFRNSKPRQRLRGIFHGILDGLGDMPTKVKQVCMVQLFAWTSWFPFLYYITTYIGSLYERQNPAYRNVKPPKQANTPLRPDSIRYGTLSLVLFAIVALTTNLILPIFVNTVGIDSYSPFGKRKASRLSRRCFNLKITTLPRAWAAAHILSTLLLLSTALTTSVAKSTLLVGVLGISWALTQWAPFAIIGAEIAQMDYQHLIQDVHTSNQPDDEEHDPENGIQRPRPAGKKLPVGAIMGIHNMSIATPQIAAAMLSSFLFWILSMWDVVGGQAIGWVLRIGGLAGIGAAWIALQIEG